MYLLRVYVRLRTFGLPLVHVRKRFEQKSGFLPFLRQMWNGKQDALSRDVTFVSISNRNYRPQVLRNRVPLLLSDRADFCA